MIQGTLLILLIIKRHKIKKLTLAGRVSGRRALRFEGEKPLSYLLERTGDADYRLPRGDTVPFLQDWRTAKVLLLPEVLRHELGVESVAIQHNHADTGDRGVGIGDQVAADHHRPLRRHCNPRNPFFPELRPKLVATESVRCHDAGGIPTRTWMPLQHLPHPFIPLRRDNPRPSPKLIHNPLQEFPHIGINLEMLVVRTSTIVEHACCPLNIIVRVIRIKAADDPLIQLAVELTGRDRLAFALPRSSDAKLLKHGVDHIVMDLDYPSSCARNRSSPPFAFLPGCATRIWRRFFKDPTHAVNADGKLPVGIGHDVLLIDNLDEIAYLVKPC